VLFWWRSRRSKWFVARSSRRDSGCYHWRAELFDSHARRPCPESRDNAWRRFPPVIVAPAIVADGAGTPSTQLRKKHGVSSQTVPRSKTTRSREHPARVPELNAREMSVTSPPCKWWRKIVTSDINVNRPDDNLVRPVLAISLLSNKRHLSGLDRQS